MRTTVTIDDELFARATELAGITERSALLRDGLETLIRVESAKRLAALGGSDSHATAAPRRRDDATRSWSTPRSGSTTSMPPSLHSLRYSVTIRSDVIVL